MQLMLTRSMLPMATERRVDVAMLRSGVNSRVETAERVS